MCNKFVITGKSNTGKSSVLDKILEDKNYRPLGFRMNHIKIEGEFRGYYIHSIKDVEGYHNNLPIQTTFTKANERLDLTKIYDTFGVACLKDVLSSPDEDYDCIVVDELGRGEHTSKDFVKYINKVLDSPKPVFVLMKNKTNEVTSEIRKRRDLLIYDLDNMSQEEVIKNIEDKIPVRESDV